MVQGPAWLLGRLQDLPATLDWLTPFEVETLAGFRPEKRRQEWLLGRWTAKRTLTLAAGERFAGSSSVELEIRPAASGALRAHFQNRQLDLRLSLSHRRGAALCAVARDAAVGCDLEWIEPRSEAFVDDYFTASEAAVVSAAEEGLTVLANGIWGAKESVLKLREGGLRTAAKALSVESSVSMISPEWHAFSVHIVGEDAAYEGWWRRLDNWVLTVATDPPANVPAGIGK